MKQVLAETDEIVVAMFPDHSRLNPVVDLYRDAVSKFGIRVERHEMQPGKLYSEPYLSWSWLYQNRNRVDILHLHYYQRLYRADFVWFTPIKFIDFTLKILFAKVLGYKLTWTAHNLFPHEPLPFFDLIGRWLVTLLASVVFVDSPKAQAIVKQHFPWIRRYAEAPHGHFIGTYPRGKSGNDIRQELNIPNTAFVFISFGLIRAYKGVGQLIEEFKVHCQEFPDSYLIIAGDPHTPRVRQVLNSLIAEHPNIRTVFKFIPAEEVESLFNAANLAIFPFSDTFTSSTVILACSLARAVIIPELGALPDYAKGGFIYYKDNSPTALQDSMKQGRQTDWVENGLAAFEYISKRTWEDVGYIMSKSWRELMENKYS